MCLEDGEPYALKGARTVLRADLKTKKVVGVLTPTGHYGSRLIYDIFYGYARPYGWIWKHLGSSDDWSPGYGISTIKQHKFLAIASQLNAFIKFRTCRNRCWNRMDHLKVDWWSCCDPSKKIF